MPSTSDSSQKQPNLRELRIGADVGGTFTDLVMSDAAGRLYVTKVLSVPHDPSVGVVNALEKAAAELNCEVGELLGACKLFVHGSTVATNTVLEGKGATVGLITTEGFRDTLEIRRGIRDDPWDHRTPYSPVLVPRYRRLPVSGRMNRDGQELTALDLDALTQALQAFERQGVDSIAVCLFNSYANAAHERLCADAIRAHIATRAASGGAGAEAVSPWLSLSHDIVPRLGEYERTSTTVLNAYIAPRTVGYLQRLDDRLHALGLSQPMLLIQNNGGSVSTRRVAEKPVSLLLSGPAAGVGALEIARQALQDDQLLSLEIGGTSADVMLMEGGRVPVSEQLQVGGYDTALPSVDIHTIGAGGGTIARVDSAGLLQVGPDGAGAHPGPAAYGFGGESPTVTDALLVLGRLKPGPYAGGSVALDDGLARGAVERGVAQPLGIDVETAAAGIVRLLEQHLLQAVEQMTLERGLDPREFTLVPAGGAGPMHGAAIGRRLGCRRIYVPRLSGAFCALGMLRVDVRHDVMRTFFHPLVNALEAGLQSVFGELESEGAALLAADGFQGDTAKLEREMDIRYIGQQWSLRVPVTAADDEVAIRGRFEAAHESRYRHTQPDGIVEVTAVHLIAHGLIPKVEMPRAPAASGEPVESSVRSMFFDADSGWVDARVFDGAALRSGHRIQGPAIVEEHTTTVCIGPRDELEVDGLGNFLVNLHD